MIKIRDILCPIDFSEFSRRALDHTVAIARCYGSQITLLHVCNVLPIVAYPPGGQFPTPAPMLCGDRNELLRALQQFAATEVGMSVPIACDIGEGDVAKEIVANARKGPGGLIVMGTHGRSGFERFVLGSVTEKVLRRADCPVLTVPAHAPDSVPVPSGLFSRIVCATDFSDCAMHALTYATSLAQETTAQLTVVHVVELPPEIPVDVHETIGGGPHSLREYVAAVTSERRDRLERAIREHVRTQCAVTTVLASGKPYREILRVAAEQAADLIVVGIQGRGAIDRLFFGSTTAHLVRQASCAVLTIRT